MYEENDGALSTSSGEVAVADKDLAKKKAKKADERKKKEAKIAAANRMAEKIFSHQAAECVKCKLLAEELSGVKGELENRARQLQFMKRSETLKDQQLLESQEKIANLESSVRAKKRVIDNLEKEKAEQVKRIKPGQLHKYIVLAS